jgi:polyphenol oxidase
MKLLHNHPRFTIYFGDATDQIYPALYTGTAIADQLCQKFERIQEELSLSALIFLKQMHSIHGYIIEAPFAPFSKEGDYLITAVSGIGIGIMTGDCLPIVFFDPITNIAAIAHAGWRGAFMGIAQQTIAHMQQAYGVDPASLQIFFGPSARQCCYSVSSAFAGEPALANCENSVLQERDNTLYFDLPTFVCRQLEQAGIARNAIDLQYNFCTICNNRFFSHRAQAAQAGRQMTVIGLK